MCKAGFAQESRGRCRALVGSADQHERPSFAPGKLAHSAAELAYRKVACARYMAECASELGRLPNIDDCYVFFVIEALVELTSLDPHDSIAEAKEKRRQKCDRSSSANNP
jgi:hypothetical protein